jgi:hypothetical protein
MEPELSREALLAAPGASSIERKLNLEKMLQERQKEEFDLLLAHGRSLGKLMLLNRRASYDWLDSLKPRAEGEITELPFLAPEEEALIVRLLKEREAFQPWTHKLAETFSTLPYVKGRFRYHEFVQKAGRLEADGWLVRVYVNHETDGE